MSCSSGEERRNLSGSLPSELVSDVQNLIERALKEDVASGDVTTLATVPKDATAQGNFLAKDDGVLSGLAVCEIVFRAVDPNIQVVWTANDGDRVRRGTVFGVARGLASSLLIAERLVLNLMQRMSGIATATRTMVDAIQAADGPHPHTRLLDTRKTVPGLRRLDKLAVVHGGGVNHRVGLYDMFLIKDNHVDAAGGVRQALEAASTYIRDHDNSRNLPVEIETRTLDEVRQVMELIGQPNIKVNRVMLDNMIKVDNVTGKVDCSLLSEALTIINGRVETEASGNVRLNTIGEIAKTKVDFVSVGHITHSVTALDISMKITNIKRP